jgi:hypothetical protein
MEYLEVIQLRAAGSIPRLPEEILSLIQGRPLGWVRLRVYRHAALETDWSLHLRWASHRAQEAGYAWTFRLVQTMKEFGLVHQSVWVEHR